METAAREIARLEARLSALRAEFRTPLEEEALRIDPVEILTGRVGDERVALLVRSISEVLPMPEVAPVMIAVLPSSDVLPGMLFGSLRAFGGFDIAQYLGQLRHRYFRGKCKRNRSVI